MGSNVHVKYSLISASTDDDLMIGNVLASKSENKMKDAAGVSGDIGAMDIIAADTQLINPHTVRTGYLFS